MKFKSKENLDSEMRIQNFFANRLRDPDSYFPGFITEILDFLILENYFKRKI